MRIRVVWFSLRNESKVHKGALGIALFPQSNAQIQMRRQVGGFKRQGLLKKDDGSGYITVFCRCGSQDRVCACIFCVEGDGFLELCDGAREIALLH